jgi:DNA-binding transcriptional MerR regulator
MTQRHILAFTSRRTNMVQWYVKEFSKLTRVSIRTLHHYDRTGLLKPSARLPNNYRLYSESDLLKLQQILALKFFGFGLKQIKKMFGNTGHIDQLRQQVSFLKQQSMQLQSAADLLETVISKAELNGSIIPNDVLKLIEAYHMTQELKNSWLGQVYTEGQLKQFAELQQKYSEKERENYNQRWKVLIAQVRENMQEDPTGPTARRLAKEWMNLVNEMYKNYPDLKQAVHTAYDKGKIPNAPFGREMMEWIEKASSSK